MKARIRVPGGELRVSVGRYHSGIPWVPTTWHISARTTAGPRTDSPSALGADILEGRGTLNKQINKIMLSSEMCCEGLESDWGCCCGRGDQGRPRKRQPLCQCLRDTEPATERLGGHIPDRTTNAKALGLGLAKHVLQVQGGQCGRRAVREAENSRRWRHRGSQVGDP